MRRKNSLIYPLPYSLLAGTPETIPVSFVQEESENDKDPVDSEQPLVAAERASEDPGKTCDDVIAGVRGTRRGGVKQAQGVRAFEDEHRGAEGEAHERNGKEELPAGRPRGRIQQVGWV